MQISPYFILIVALIIVMGGILSMTRKQLGQKAAKEVFIAVLLLLFSLICFALSLLLTDMGLKIFFHELKFLSLAFLAPATLFIYLKFTGRAISSGRAAALLIIPCITAVLALTGNYHTFFRIGMEMVLHNGFYYIMPRSAWWYWVYTVYSYALYLIGIGILADMYYKKPRIYRGQIWLMISTAAAAVAAGMIALAVRYEDYGDISLISGSVVSIIQYITIVRYSPRSHGLVVPNPGVRIWNDQPRRAVLLARSIIVSDIGSPVMIFDHMNRLIDANKNAVELMEELDFNDPRPDGSVIYMPKSDKYFRVGDKCVYDENGQMTGRVVVLNDVTTLEKTAGKLIHIATHDELTGLENSQAFYSAARLLKEKDLPVCFVYLNITGMKLINAIYGNDYGDTVIIRAAQTILSENVCCARLYGDEFGVMMKNASAVDGEAFIERINMKLSETRADDGEEGVYAGDVSVYANIAIMTDFQRSAEDIISEAGASLRKNPSHEDLFIYSCLLNAIKRLAEMNSRRAVRITELCARIAERLSSSDTERKKMSLLSSVYDIGLLSAPPSLLRDVGNLTNEQWEEWKLHTLKGYNIALSIPALSEIASEILSHHERYDGLGYPNGLKGDDIPIMARILAAVEFYVDAPDGREMELLWKRRGTQFDPAVVDAIGLGWSRG